MDKDVEELLSRGVEKVIPKELAKKKLLSGDKLRIYLGVDPTGSKLHLGHSVPLRKLRAFADQGHEVIFLVGSFTAMIGDPSGRDIMRAPLTRPEVEKNFETYKEQAGKILDFSKVTVRYNHEWLDTLTFADLIGLASNFTVQQMLQRDMFEKRIKEGNPIALHEFFYPLMVGYDSVVLDVDCELGGSDQEFNMLAGRTLQTAFKKRDKFVLTTKLIEGTDGRKMSKTYNNAVYLEDSPIEMYGKLMSVKDELVPTYFECLTNLPIEEVQGVLKEHPKKAKMRLAYEITKIYHSAEVASKAEANFEETFSKKGVPTEIEGKKAKKGDKLADVAMAQGVVASKTEWRRLIREGAVTNLLTGKTIESAEEEVMEAVTLKVGKHRFLKIEVE
jgi:tyrosyl-tRNA synthetase